MLNLIEWFLAIIKGRMKRVRDFIEDDLSSGSVDTCNNTPISVIDYSLYKDDNFWSSTNILKKGFASEAKTQCNGNDTM